jgi:putative solute:sodium symporter small subunit
MTPENRAAYWEATLHLLVTLLVIWFLVSFGFGILLAEALNSIPLGGFKLGFWFAQQGSIFAFVLLGILYALRMNRIDEHFDVREE